MWNKLKRDIYLPSIDWKDPAHLRALVLLASVLVLIFKMSCMTDGDFICFYSTSQALFQRINPYSSAIYPKDYGVGFPYPPIVFLWMAPACSLPYGFALIAWTLECMLLLMTTLFLWVDLLIGTKKLMAPETIHVMLACFIAPAIWSFWMHHTTAPIFFAATLSLWLMQKKNSSWGSGIAAGMLTLKPHLMIFAGCLLLINAKSKPRFLAGALMMVALSLTPFLGWYRSPKDLKDFFSSATKHSALYVKDDQNLISNIYSKFLLKNAVTKNMSHHLSFSNDSNIIAPLLYLKKLFLGMVLIFWAFFLCNPPKIPLTYQMSIALALGVICSIYSHSYDSTLLIPLFMCSFLAFTNQSHRVDIVLLFIVLNLFLSVWIPFGFNFTKSTPTAQGYVGLLYIGISAVLYFYHPLCLKTQKILLSMKHACNNDKLNLESRKT